MAAQGKYDQALGAVDRAPALDPANPFVPTDAARIYHFARRYDDAIRYFRKAIALSPNDSYPHLYLPVSLLLAGRPDEAFNAMIASARMRNKEDIRRRYRQGGWNAVWLKTLETMDGLPKKPWMHWRQWAAILLHRNEEALDQLPEVESAADALQRGRSDLRFDSPGTPLPGDVETHRIS